jgi:DNA polymerase elongation subunit (family B)
LLENEEGDNTTDGDFTILENELINTIITSEILNVLRRICASRELKEIYDCKVIRAAYYPKSLEVSKEEYLDILERQNLKRTYCSDNKKWHTILDGRSRYWTKIPLSNVMVKLRELRRDAQNNVKNDIEVEKNDAVQKLLKDIQNSIYGVIASKYFEINNVILANNITARARVWIWMI